MDGQSSHFLGIFASYLHDEKVEKVLLAFTTIGEEDNFSAESHQDALMSVLEIFGKNMSNVVCLVGDNCATNVALARLCDIPLIGIFQNN